jgi:hypothetical protein
VIFTFNRFSNKKENNPKERYSKGQFLNKIQKRAAKTAR